MKRDRFEYLCGQAEAGDDAFVRHPATREEGMVVSCDLSSGNMLVETPDRQTRRWAYSECDDLRHPKIGPMI